MNKVRFIGDVHGKYERYKRAIADVERSVQVGDMGVGFRHYDPHEKYSYRHGVISGNPPYDYMKRGDHRFIRGNHDNPGECARHQFWIHDGMIENGVMYIGGGLSIDARWRVKDFSWWEDEELSIDELNSLVDIYKVIAPPIMVSHETPESVACQLMNKEKLEYPSRTRQAFQSMFEIHQPRLWIFGHWHHSFDTIINHTRFVCLNELEYMDIDLDEYK